MAVEGARILVYQPTQVQYGTITNRTEETGFVSHNINPYAAIRDKTFLCSRFLQNFMVYRARGTESNGEGPRFVR